MLNVSSYHLGWTEYWADTQPKKHDIDFTASDEALGRILLNTLEKRFPNATFDWYDNDASNMDDVVHVYDRYGSDVFTLTHSDLRNILKEPIDSGQWPIPPKELE